MNFNTFTKFASKLKDAPLPGEESHYKMAPSIRIKALGELNLGQRKPKKAAVVALFYPDEALNTRLLLMLRKTYNGVHSNQVGFPGGKLEKEDKDFRSAALRETHEEVGVAPDKIEIFKELSEVYIPPSNFMVRPFMGIARETPLFTPQEEEVETVIEALFSDVMDDGTTSYETLSTSYAKNIDVPVFKLNGYTVWGATAMMLNEVKTLFKLCVIP